MKVLTRIIISLVLLNFSIGKSIQDCQPAYSTCNLGKEGFINVHVVPHT